MLDDETNTYPWPGPRPEANHDAWPNSWVECVGCTFEKVMIEQAFMPYTNYFLPRHFTQFGERAMPGTLFSSTGVNPPIRITLRRLNRWATGPIPENPPRNYHGLGITGSLVARREPTPAELLTELMPDNY